MKYDIIYGWDVMGNEIDNNQRTLMGVQGRSPNELLRGGKR